MWHCSQRRLVNQLPKTMLARVSWGVGLLMFCPPKGLSLPQTFLYEPPLLGVGRLCCSLQTNFLAIYNWDSPQTNVLRDKRLINWGWPVAEVLAWASSLYLVKFILCFALPVPRPVPLCLPARLPVSKTDGQLCLPFKSAQIPSFVVYFPNLFCIYCLWGSRDVLTTYQKLHHSIWHSDIFVCLRQGLAVLAKAGLRLTG